MNITDELKAKYQSLIDKGYTTKQISAETNISWSTTKYNLRKLGLETIHKIKPRPISKNQLDDFVKRNYSTYQIASELNRSQGSVKHWLKKYELKTNPAYCIRRNEIKKEIESGFKTCSKCKQIKPLNKDNFYIRKSGAFHYWCRKCNDRISLEKQTERKRKCVEYKGGKCVICGYNRYLGSLDFHHLDPAKKDYNISNLRTYSMEKLYKELDKCILVCKNCHCEIHGKVGPSDVSRTHKAPL
jgi:transposase